MGHPKEIRYFAVAGVLAGEIALPVKDI